MNFTVIPFFLAANVVINDTNEWSHGPEFIYETSITVMLFDIRSYEPAFYANMTNIMKCRPKSETSLFCKLSDTIVNRSDRDMPEVTDADAPFEVTFNPRGVESIKFTKETDASIESIQKLKFIANELSLGADLEENANALPGYVRRQPQILGECSSFFKVTHYEGDDEDFEDESTEEKSYTLNVLPLPEQTPDSTVIIKKRAQWNKCVERPQDYYHPVKNANMAKTYSDMNITSSGEFRSVTEIVGFPWFNRDVMKIQYLRFANSVTLQDIRPAEEEWPSIEFQHSTTLPLINEIKFKHLPIGK